jgi:hypothetical protein
MATTLVSTGLQFPDASIQTTAVTAGQFTATASGAITNGNKLVVNANGTVSAVVATAITPVVNAKLAYRNGNPATNLACAFNGTYFVFVYTVSSAAYAICGKLNGTNIIFGNEVTLQSSATSQDVTCDTSTGNFVLAWATSASGNACVASVTDNVITTYTSIGVATAGVIACEYDSTNNKVVFAYAYSSNQGFAKVGTISGNNITVGTAANFTTNVPADTICLQEDKTNGKIVVAYQDSSSSAQGFAAVGTVSGTSISFGTPVQFGGDTGIGGIKSTYDTTNSKIIFAYSYGGETSYTIVATVSGTSISFGTEQTFATNTSAYPAIAYDFANQKVFLTYSNDTLGGCEYVSGTLSGTSISYGTPVVFDTDNGQAFANVAIRGLGILVNYYDSTGTIGGRGVVISTSSTNLTSKNYIGIANNTYSNGATATVQTIGSVDDAQSGLTTGSPYYLQMDGTLSTAADPLNVYAGIAISATKIVVKG